MTPCSLGDLGTVSLSRLVIAHGKISEAAKVTEVIDLEKTRDGDLDKMLPESELKSLREKFFARYHLTWRRLISCHG